MTSDIRRRVEELFEAALIRPPGERQAYVAAAADGDARLLAEVTALLGAHGRAGGVLERPLPPPPPPPPPDHRIGPYRIVGELGRGGMGVVYAAERDDGHFRRRVAIKVLRADADPSLEARVVAERQILASLDHPNIARLLDGGITADGRPFLVMEHVDGLPIDVFADRMRLTVRERVGLFVTVAEAVQHAHRNLVVHRDLKPSNILVTSRGDVKLLDFGIAKLLNPALGPDTSPVTLGGQRALTPEFASPEQVRGDPLSTATDVYSLGVVLYRLLVGRPPYALEADSMKSVVDVVSRQPPIRPSEAVTRGDSAGIAEIATSRRATPDRLVRSLRGDLDEILLQALRKQPSDRYGSADLLARDLDRHLAGQPVEARKGARGYRLRSFLRRHRVGLGVAAVVALSLVGGASAAVWQARLADQARQRAEETLRQSEEITAFLMSLFTVSDPDHIRLEEITAADLLRRGLLRVEALSSQPLVQARMLGVIGSVNLQLGQYDDAVRLQRRALAGLMAELGPGNPEVAAAMNGLGLSLRNIADYEEARSLHHEALRLQWETGAPDTAVATTLGHIAYIEFDLNRRAALQRESLELQRGALGTAHPEVMETLMALANTERGLGHHDESVALLREALDAGQSALGRADPRAAVPMLHLGDILFHDLNQPEDAESLYRRALAIQESRLGPGDLLLIHGLHSLGDLLGRTGRHAEAEAVLRQAIAILGGALGEAHPRAVGSNLNLAAELFRQGRYQEAESLYHMVIDGWERTRGTRHPSVATARAALGDALVDLGRLDEAESEIRAALGIRRQSLGERSIMVGLSLTQLGDVARRQGERERARATYLEARDILLEQLAPNHPQVQDVDLRLRALELAEVRGPTTSGRRN